MTASVTTALADAEGMSLARLVGVLAKVDAKLIGSPEVRVIDVSEDSRQICPGALFVARDGGQVRGTDLTPQALASGASAVMMQRGTGWRESIPVPVIEVRDVALALGIASEAVHGYPTSHLSLTGITGTNGKTTTAVLVEQALIAAARKPALLGTLGSAFDGEQIAGKLTTPPADEISRFAHGVLQRGGTDLVMEVSSHALALGRVDALRFEVAAFTNLTQDHLDFHGTMDAYAAHKRRLFSELKPEISVINTEGEWGRSFAATARSSRVLRVGRSVDVDVRPVDVTLDARGLRGDVLVAGKTVELVTNLVGAHNLENILVALGILAGLGVDASTAAQAWREVRVPGRLERCDSPADDITVLVDYAHTPDALGRVLATCRRATTGRLICVFGCGGDRDPLKRSLMGSVVAELADRIVVTNDNPRTEDPARIVSDIERGLASRQTEYQVLLDRSEAIRRAVGEARGGDLVLIAGKGHEPYQIIGTTRTPFDDRVEARRALLLRREVKAS